MQNKMRRGLICFGLVLLSIGTLMGCKEFQQAAEGAAQNPVTNGSPTRSGAAEISSPVFFLLAIRRNNPLDKRLPYR